MWAIRSSCPTCPRGMPSIAFVFNRSGAHEPEWTTVRHQTAGSHQGLLDRGSRDTRALERERADRAWRVRVDRWTVRVRQIDPAVHFGAPRLPDAGVVRAERPARRRAPRLGARACAESRDRLHLSELQLDWRPDGLRERGTAPHLP